MIAGGTFNTTVFQNDLNQIQSGQYATPSLLRLPLLSTFHATVTSPIYGARPDLATGTAQNPIVNNVANGARISPTRIIIPEPANSLQLVWHALDPGGGYECSYPLNSAANATTFGWPIETHWAFGWLRVNGLGPWFPMSLFKSVDIINTGQQNGIFPWGGFSAITGAMSFVDWVGYWDGLGDITTGPSAGNAYILAITSVNMSLSSNGGSLGDVANYAVPSGSGPQQTPPNTDTQRNQDTLVRANSNGR